ncbi:MAG: trehalose-phosphatase [Paracoccaceae bacterium]|jgi:alpha,alpha-trehalase|nr:trehalose-phosphatase [Paracoccaceae bacterium]
MATRPETDEGIAAAVLDLAGIAADTSPEGSEAARRFAGALRRAGLPLAAVTASGDAPAPIGRSAPDFAAAARALDAPPERMVAVSANVAGVSEAATASFGTVVGLRAEQSGEAEARRHALRAAGADLVAPGLDRLLLPDESGLRTLATLPPVWDRLAPLATQAADRGVAVFLDFDGTLAPIVADHRDAALPEGMEAEIAALAARCPTAIVSGRDLADVRVRVGVTAAIHAGSHGFDIVGPGGLAARPEAAERFLPYLDRAEAALRDRLGEIEGAEVERKTFSVAVHFRSVAAADLPEVARAVDAAAASPELRKGRGRKVWEIQPRAEWDKGRAVAWLLDHTPMGGGGRLPVYVGDDLTDEDAFAVLAGRGLCLAVRGDNRPTLADATLEGPDDVRRLIGWLAGQPS